MFKSKRNRDRLFKTRLLSIAHKNKKRGGVVNTEINPFPEPQDLTTQQGIAVQQGFTVQDILWALGIWTVTISLSPVIAFYMLMVA